MRYRVAYFLPRGDERMVVAEVLDFPGVVSQGFDLADARLMIASALEEIAQLHLEEGKALPVPNLEATAADRTQATITVEGPWLIAYRRTLARRALGRLYALCQTAAAL